MITWVVTGPIGAGKSSVTQMLVDRGAAHLDADLLGHQVLATPAVVDAISLEFGSQFVRQGKIDRGLLGSHVFSNEAALNRLNALTHPALIALAQSRLQDLSFAAKHKLAVLEAAVYFLWPPLEDVDLVISVVADEEIRRQRLRSSRGLADPEITDRFSAQKSMEAFWKKADIVLENNNDPKVLKLAVEELLKRHNL